MSVAPEAAIEVTSAMRPGARLRVPRLHAEPDAARVAEAAAGHAAVLLTGGEPTLRADLPRLLAACAEAGAAVRIRTDGLALGRAAALAPLQRAGLTGLRVLLASARRDAHDWLVGLSGAATAASRAVRVATAAGLPVEVEIPIARPTAPLLAETVNVAARLGASAVHLRLLGPAEVAPDDRVALLAEPRLLVGPLADARRAAGRADLDWTDAGLPSSLSPPPPPATDPLQVALDGAPRALKVALLRAAAGAPTLRVIDVDHPDAAALLREAARMGFRRVEVRADLSPLVGLTDDELRRLRRIDAFESTAPSPEVDALLARLARVNPDTELRS